MSNTIVLPSIAVSVSFPMPSTAIEAATKLYRAVNSSGNNGVGHGSVGPAWERVKRSQVLPMVMV